MSTSLKEVAGQPIGVFDSGVGGLTVATALMRRLPRESILYLGDTARLPYGTKSPQTVRRYVRRNVDFLIARGVKAVIVACNTASALALDDFAAQVPVWGVVEPGAQQAARVARQKLGIIATESTVRSDAYGQAVRRWRPELEIISQACPLFVPLVEEGWGDDEITFEIARRYIEPLLDQGIDALVLGCTHYPVLTPLLLRLIGQEVRLVDSAEAVSFQVAAELERLGGLNPTDGVSHHFFVTDAGARFRRISEDLLHRALPDAPPIQLEWVEL